MKQHRHVRRVGPFWAAGLHLAFFAIPALAASVAGIVVTDSGQPVSGARVFFSGQSACSRGSGGIDMVCTPMPSKWTETASDGRFAVDELLANVYNPCVSRVGTIYLSTCEWIGSGETGPINITLSQDQRVENVRFILRRGTLAVFKVRDEAGWTAKSLFFFGVYIGRSYQRAEYNSDRQAYLALLPRGAGASLFIDTPLTVQDEAGNILPIDTVGTAPFITGGDEMSFTLSVSAPLVNAASYLPGIGQGDIVTLFGTGLTDIQGLRMAQSFPLPTEIAGTSVTINGLAAPLFGVAKQDGIEQVNFQFPHSFDLVAPLTVKVTNNGKSKTYYSRTWPSLGIFATVGDRNGNVISQLNPAAPGDAIAIYFTGMNAFFPFVPDGVPAPTFPPTRCAPYLVPDVRIGGRTAQVNFCGASPGAVGLGRLDVIVPSGIESGLRDVRVAFGTTLGNIVKLEVQEP